MFASLKELYSLLTTEQRNKLLRLQLLVILMSFAEIAGVVSIGPFMALVIAANSTGAGFEIRVLYDRNGQPGSIA
jgi:HlyD family secretion protein